MTHQELLAELDSVVSRGSEFLTAAEQIAKLEKDLILGSIKGACLAVSSSLLDRPRAWRHFDETWANLRALHSKEKVAGLEKPNWLLPKEWDIFGHLAVAGQSAAVLLYLGLACARGRPCCQPLRRDIQDAIRPVVEAKADLMEQLILWTSCTGEYLVAWAREHQGPITEIDDRLFLAAKIECKNKAVLGAAFNATNQAVNCYLCRHKIWREQQLMLRRDLRLYLDNYIEFACLTKHWGETGKMSSFLLEED